MISPQVALDMIKMMNSVVENGTGRRASSTAFRLAGKTGTTNGWRDAWFVGYTGNFVGAVWMGNDDYSPTKRMTGGTLPAMTWHNIMTYAHQGIELRPLPGSAAADPRARRCRRLVQGRRRAASGAADPQGYRRPCRMSSTCSTMPTTRSPRTRRPPGPLGALDGGKSATVDATFATAADTISPPPRTATSVAIRRVTARRNFERIDSCACFSDHVSLF